VISKRPFAGNTGTVDDKDEVQRNLNDTNYNRMWEYNNRGIGRSGKVFRRHGDGIRHRSAQSQTG
ncbi:hypothetical protein ONQ60_26825, partial [Salmonella enterica subsp. enterica serovar Virginia]|nr:hypothetical protein [Salmonella enterica subsp. enterica serovar Virginia]